MKIRRIVWILIAVAAVCFVHLLAAGANKTPPMPKDNSECLVCHSNFEKEDIASIHLKNGVTCAYCHGISIEHMDDEECAATPDILFGRAEVGPFCKKCHAAHKDPDAVAKFLAERKSKRMKNGRLILDNAICTDCHGSHRLPGTGGGRSGLK